MKIISRKDAITAGLKLYFTGAPCGKGHISPKSVAGWKCQECKREDDACWRNTNQVKVKAIQAKFKTNNPVRAAEIKNNYKKRNSEKISSANKAYTQENRERIAIRLKMYSAANRERISKRMRGYNEANRGLVAALASKYRASKVSATPGWASLGAIRCIYEKARAVGMEVDHIIPLQGRLVCGLHVENNLQLIQRTQNRQKSNKFNPDEFEVRFLG